MHAVPNRKYRIGRSRTGLGLYATKPFRKREYIVTYRGRRLPQCGRRQARGARLALHVRDQHALDHRRLQALERGALRQPFVPAERGGYRAPRPDHRLLRPPQDQTRRRNHGRLRQGLLFGLHRQEPLPLLEMQGAARRAQAKRRARVKRARAKRLKQRREQRAAAKRKR